MADVYELAGTSRTTSDAVARRHGLTTPRWHLLSAVSDRPRTASEAARRLGLTRQSVQRAANELVAAGLLSAAPDPADARAPLLAPTPAGHEALRAVVADGDRRRERALADAALTSDELDLARAVLRRLADALAAPPRPDDP